MAAFRFQYEESKTTVPYTGSEEAIEMDNPGKPIAIKKNADSVTLQWNSCTSDNKDYYELRFKDVFSKDRWTNDHNEYFRPRAEIQKLKADTKYIFQVRVVRNDETGEWSPQSDEICTTSPPTTQMVSLSTLIEKGNPSRYALPMREIKRARDETIKTKKYEIGKPSGYRYKEKTIMLVGETGTGKSTLVDGIANYVLGVNWDDAFRFQMVKLEKEEAGRLHQQAVSQTEWVSQYSINPGQGNRLGYRLNIIDTPGFGDTRGIDKDHEVIDQIRYLFSRTGDTGVVYIDAVCFLVKASDVRLTVTQTYIFHAIMSLFGRDIEHNICTLVTFADGDQPKVLSALTKSGLPFGKHFKFNNSALFANNLQVTESSFSSMFWNMGVESYRSFFDHIAQTQTKSLLLTKEVLEERHRLETTLQNLVPQVDAGLSVMNSIQQERHIIEQHETDIEANKDFEYEVTEQHAVKHDLPANQHVSNCITCNVTCHRPCKIPLDKDKHGCSAMGSDGQCMQCPGKCLWSKHYNNQYYFGFKAVTKRQTYNEKLEKYKKASGDRLSVKQVLKKMDIELRELETGVQSLMLSAQASRTRLLQIALRPNPLSVVHYIDMMIETEELEGDTAGVMERISSLKVLRKKAEIEENAKSFRQKATKAHETVQRSININIKVPRICFSLFDFLLRHNID